MCAILVALGIFLWSGFAMITFVFLTTKSENSPKRLMKSVKFTLTGSVGPEFGISLMKVTGILWIFTGLIISIIGESYLQGTIGDIVLGIIFLAPVWIGAIIAE